MTIEQPLKRGQGTSTIMFTHNDLDGVGCGIIHKKVYGSKAETHYCGYHNVDEKIQRRLKELQAAGETPNIIISDLGIERHTAELLHQYSGEKVLLDHHVTNQWIADEYAWAHIDVDKCGTLLVFYHLIDYTFQSPLFGFASMVDDYDRWIHNQPNSVQLNRLLYTLGRDDFEERCIMRKYPEELDSTDLIILSVEAGRINNYIDKLERTTIIEVGQDDKHFGIVYADQYQSEAAHALIDRLELDMIVLVDANNLKLSMRSKDDFDVGKIAKNLGGGGHKNAAGINFGNPSIKASDERSKIGGKLYEANFYISATTDSIIQKVMNEHYSNETAQIAELFNV